MQIRRGYLEIVLCTLTWGTIGPITHHLALPPAVIAFFREAFGLVVVSAWLLARRRWHELRPRKHIGLMVFSGMVLSAHWALQFEAFKRTSVATAILVIFLGPVLTAAAAPLVLRERARPVAYAALGVAFGGLALISLAKIGHASATGLLAALGSAAGFGTLLLCDKVLTREYTPASIVVWQLVVAMIVLSPALASTSARAVGHGLGWLALLGIVHTGMLGIVFFHAVRALEMQRLGVLYYLEPASAIVYAWWLVHERPTAMTLVGGALIVLAGLAIIWTDRNASLEPLPT